MSSPYLGLDLGSRNTGVALSESGLLAQPLTTLNWKPPHSGPHIEEIVALIKERQIATVVVGIPLGEEGEVTAQAPRTEALIAQLEHSLQTSHLKVEVVRTNEFHSTQDALERFPDVDKDAAAAALILQDYLDQHGGEW